GGRCILYPAERKDYGDLSPEIESWLLGRQQPAEWPLHCSNCQAEILDNSPFCSKCGTPTHVPHDAAATATHSLPLSPGGELPSGAVLAGKYRIIEIVGRGG